MNKILKHQAAMLANALRTLADAIDSKAGIKPVPTVDTLTRQALKTLHEQCEFIGNPAMQYEDRFK